MIRYQLTIDGITRTVSERVALQASSGRPIPPEGLAIGGEESNITEPDKPVRKLVAFIVPIAE